MYNAVLVFCYTAAIQKTAVITFRVSFFFERSQIFFFSFFHHLQTSNTLHSAPLRLRLRSAPFRVWRFGDGGKKKKKICIAQKKKNAESITAVFWIQRCNKKQNGVIYIILLI